MDAMNLTAIQSEQTLCVITVLDIICNLIV